MRVLGIDPSSTHTGIVVAEGPGKPLYHGEIVPKKLTGFDRISYIVQEVMGIKNKYAPDHIYIEEVFVGHASSAVQLISLGAVLRYFLWQEDIPYVDMPNKTLKKFVTGNGNANKELIMMHVLKNWGFESPTNNVADAYSLAMAGLVIHGGMKALNAAQRESVAKLAKIS